LLLNAAMCHVLPAAARSSTHSRLAVGQLLELQLSPKYKYYMCTS